MRSSILILGLVACGGSGGPGGGGGDGPGIDADTSHVDPHLIAGGGVADSPVSGLIHVYVVENGTSTPIAGAGVRIEAATPLIASTDASGLATFTDASLTGKQTISATAAGHAAATWIGANGANVTVPLGPTQSTVPTAHVTGTIAGWDQLPGPSSLSHYTLGFVLYSFLDDPSAPENSIVQPTNSGTPANTCLRTFVSNPTCNWQLTARTGLQIHTAVIVDGDTHGTNNDTSDDTYTLIGYAAGSSMTLTAGQNVTGESLAAVSSMSPLSITVPGAPSGLGHVLTIPELAIGDAGRIVFPLPPIATGSSTPQVIAATGAFAGHYEVVSLATPSASAKQPYSSGFAHDVSSSATVPAWLGAPAQLTTGATFGFSDPGAVAFHTAQFTRGSNIDWDVALLDGSTSFTLPAISPDPLGTGSVTFAVSAIDLPGFDPGHFDVPSNKTALVRAAGAQTTFTH